LIFKSLQELVVHKAISLLGDLIDQPYLEQFIDNLKHKVFCEEVVVVLANPPIDAVERKPVLLLFQL